MRGPSGLDPAQPTSTWTSLDRGGVTAATLVDIVASATVPYLHASGGLGPCRVPRPVLAAMTRSASPCTAYFCPGIVTGHAGMLRPADTLAGGVTSQGIRITGS
jgi:hypothetical protein